MRTYFPSSLRKESVEIVLIPLYTSFHFLNASDVRHLNIESCSNVLSFRHPEDTALCVELIKCAGGKVQVETLTCWMKATVLWS